MLTELVNVLPGALTQHIPVLIPGDTAPLIPVPPVPLLVLEALNSMLSVLQVSSSL